MKPRHKRLAFLMAGLVVLAAAAWLVFRALGDNLSYFFSPTEVVEGKAPHNHVFRLGGLVQPGSFRREDQGQEVVARFVVTDNHQSVEVRYAGILPDLFQEGQGVIAKGRMGPDGVFLADEVLAKHDETYMPPEVAEALEEGHRRGIAEMAKGGGK